MTLIELQRETRLSPVSAWRAWTTNDGMAAWWWPQWLDTDYRFEPEKDRHYRIASESVGVGVAGTFTTVEREKELAFDWRWEDGEGVGAPQQVTVRFEPAGQGTRVSVTHACSPEDEAGLRQGWNDVLDRFAELH